MATTKSEPKAKQNLDGYGAPLIPWTKIRERLEQGFTFDIVVEGRATRVTEPALVARIAKIYQAQGWPAAVSDDGVSLTAEYSAPSAGPPPYMVYEVTPETVFALGTTEPYGATSFRL
jgi:hypothetical protein